MMNSFHEWRQLNEHLAPKVKNPKKPKERKLQKNGGVSVNKDVAMRHDLIVLPPEVEGTNCGNCEYYEKQDDTIGYCAHKEIRQWVTPRMCCNLWDHGKIKRAWKRKD